MVVIHESLRETSIWHVGQVLSPAWCILIRVTVTLSGMSGILSLQSSRSIFVYCCGIEDLDMDMVMIILSL
jgi:hypothetical protein